VAEKVAIIGAGPAGLMAAEVISAAGFSVDVYDAMPSVGRKFLRAGIGGLNLTHDEDHAQFVQRYGAQQTNVARWLEEFPPAALRDWAQGLGIETFVGSSGRVFPVAMKAAPLLRAWLRRLNEQGVRFHLRHRWQGWTNDGVLLFTTPSGEQKVDVTKGNPRGIGNTATLLALGGGSWARLGSDGKWQSILAARGIELAPLRPSNCGFDIAWSDHLRTRFAGQPLKAVTASIGTLQRHGEFMITRHGVEGGLIYALSAPLRDAIEANGSAELKIDLAPGRSLARLQTDLAHPQGRDTLANHLRRRAGIEGLKAAMLREVATAGQLRDMEQLAPLIKAVPLILKSPRPIDEAISTAGGVKFGGMTDDLMQKDLSGVFCAGEMLDWEAPTGGYLLTACLASGRIAGNGVLRYLANHA
jgi:uncharacterized flavoprotein (TIGR03862 family)